MIVIIDDELIFAEKLKKELVQHYNEKEIVTMCEFDYEFLTQNDVDILFLDIELKNENGIDIARYCRKSGYKNINIVFVSSHNSYVYDTFEVRPIAFIRKEAISEDLKKCVSLIDRKRSETKILINDTLVNLLDILYIESEANYVYYRLKNGLSIKSRTKLSKIEKELEKYNFMRCHTSYIVNAEHVTKIHADFLTLEDNIKISISRSWRDSFFDKYRDFYRKIKKIG